MIVLSFWAFVWNLVEAVSLADAPTTIPLPHIRGKELYDDLCFQCHGQSGLADTALAKTMGAPALAGVFQEKDYAKQIALIQEGRGVMPSYEMVIDKHDSKRILIYLSGLDPQTGDDPRVKTETTTPQETTKPIKDSDTEVNVEKTIENEEEVP